MLYMVLIYGDKIQQWRMAGTTPNLQFQLEEHGCETIELIIGGLHMKTKKKRL